MPIPEFTITLDQKKYLTNDVMLLSFTLPSSISFNAGQYVMLKIVQGNELRWKPYSILNSPSRKGKLDICAKIIPGGFASEAFKSMQSGEIVTVRGPFGHFIFNEADENPEYWFIAAGTGVAPLYSMLTEYLPRLSDKKFVLLFGVRQQSNLFLHEEFKRLAQQFSQFTYVPTLSQDSWEGHFGRVQQHLPDDVTGKTFYLCGLKEMVLETRELLLSKGVASQNIKFERYS